MKRENIKREAKKIMDSFARALQKVKVEESKVERKEDRRVERDGFESDEEFRKILFSNAPKKSGDFIQGEKGEWVE